MTLEAPAHDSMGGNAESKREFALPKHIYICKTCGQDETCTSKQAAERLRRRHRILAHGGLPTRHERIVPVPDWGGIPRSIAMWIGIALTLLAIEYLLPLLD